MKTRLKQSEYWLIQLQMCDPQFAAAYRGMDFAIEGIDRVSKSNDELVFCCHRDQLWQLGIELGKSFDRQRWSQVGVRMDAVESETPTATRFPYSLVDFHHHFVEGWLVKAVMTRELVCQQQPIVEAEQLNQPMAQEYFLYHESANCRSVSTRDLFIFADRCGLHQDLHWAAIESYFSYDFSRSLGQKAFINVDPNHYYCSEYGWAEILDVVSGNDYGDTELIFEVSLAGVGDPRMTSGFAAQLRSYGFQVALDDWGRDNNSLGTLNLVRPDFVKVSSDLVHGAHSDQFRHKMIAGMVATAKDLGMTVIAEGIQDADDCDWAIEIGFDGLQGRYLGESVTSQEPSHTNQWLPMCNSTYENHSLFGRCQSCLE